MKRFKAFLYCGIKVDEWDIVHYEIETGDGGGWHNSGECRMYHFTARWFYFLGVPLWRTYFHSEDKGVYDERLWH